MNQEKGNGKGKEGKIEREGKKGEQKGEIIISSACTKGLNA